ncbi:MAG TPA: exonuclease domain-containing protein [Cytophagales bacterium]|nr:exonuclease domain-containing protein [Cytophagales bacterium]
MNFTAIDFETATSSTKSICQIGLVRIENYEIVAEIDLLVRPYNNFYNFYNSKIHGINAKMTKDAPEFDEIWDEIAPYIAGQKLVAHDKKFEEKCLRDTLKMYDLHIPLFEFGCTFDIYGKSLDKLCKEFGIELKHHNALSDAKACALLYMQYLKGSL